MKFQSAMKRVTSLVVLFVFLMAFSACGNKGTVSLSEALENGTFYFGVSIAGVDVNGLTVDEAKPELDNMLSSALDRIEIELQYDGNSWILKSSDLGAHYNIDAAIEEAILIGRAGSSRENKAQIAQAKEQGINIEPVITYEQSNLDAAIAKVAAEIDSPPEEPVANFTFDGAGEVTFTPGKNGATVKKSELSTLIIDKFEKNIFPAVVQIPVETTLTTRTVEQLQANTQRISHCKTKFSSKDQNRTDNLILGASKLNGYCVAPGAKFSFNEVLGAREAANGWKEALVIVNGSDYDLGMGGGICQVSTTLYVAVVRADLQVDTRYKHSIPSSYVDRGLDATVAYGSKDLVFTNNTEYPIYIAAHVDTKSLTIEVSLFGRPLADGVTVDMRSEIMEELKPEPAEEIYDETAPAGSRVAVRKERSGYVVDVYKDYFMNGVLDRSVKLYTDTYKPVRGIVTVGVAAETPSDNIPSIDNIPDEQFIIPQEG